MGEWASGGGTGIKGAETEGRGGGKLKACVNVLAARTKVCSTVKAVWSGDGAG